MCITRVAVEWSSGPSDPEPPAVQWNAAWTNLKIVFVPQGEMADGSGGFSYQIRLYQGGELVRTSTLLTSAPIVLNNHTLTLGNDPGADDPSVLNTGPFNGAMRDFRLWSSTRTNYGNPQINASHLLTGQELGLLTWLRMDELEGAPVDHARNRSVVFDAGWWTEETQYALDFSELDSIRISDGLNGSDYQKEENTIEFWFHPQTNATDTAVMWASGSAALSSSALLIIGRLELLMTAIPMLGMEAIQTLTSP